MCEAKRRRIGIIGAVCHELLWQKQVHPNGVLHCRSCRRCRRRRAGSWHLRRHFQVRRRRAGRAGRPSSWRRSRLKTVHPRVAASDSKLWSLRILPKRWVQVVAFCTKGLLQQVPKAALRRKLLASRRQLHATRTLRSPSIPHVVYPCSHLANLLLVQRGQSEGAQDGSQNLTARKPPALGQVPMPEPGPSLFKVRGRWKLGAAEVFLQVLPKPNKERVGQELSRVHLLAQRSQAFHNFLNGISL
mmetsp:Transcript_38737/g.92550  ORF Transcript_38737/g.92550 Transcript_38737/m.92550 type:complete len:245 (-) Transcript_38737:868-1602(-)